jgi:hypothetical protein
MQDDVRSAVAEQLGITMLPPEDQEALIAQMSGVLLQAASLAVLAALPEGKRAGFMALAETGDEAALKEYLAQELPGSENIVRAAVAEEVRRFRESKAT